MRVTGTGALLRSPLPGTSEPTNSKPGLEIVVWRLSRRRFPSSQIASMRGRTAFYTCGQVLAASSTLMYARNFVNAFLRNGAPRIRKIRCDAKKREGVLPEWLESTGSF